jgi:PAS domain S-box-containing protein
VKHQLADLLDIPRLQSALDNLYLSTRIPSSIIDNEGNIHTGSGWQEVCTKFHRVHPEARKRCIESDLYISRHIHEANPSITYKCPHGLVDSATPIIIEGEHIGNVFTGQLFNEEPDLEYFRAQGRAYGFGEEEYIDAVKKVPVISEQALRENLAFLAHLTEMLAEMGLKRAREKEAERRLSESEERYRALFSRAGDGIFIMSPDGKLVDVNESFARMHGYSAGELTLMNIRELATQKTIDLIPERLRRVIAGETLTFDVEHYHRDGHVFPLEVSASMISFGGESYIQCFQRDITERVRAEKALLESERSLKRSQEVAHVGNWTWEAGSNRVTWSDEMYRIFGLVPGNLDGDLDDVIRRTIHPEDLNNVLAANRAVIKTRQPAELEYRVVRPDGTVRDVWAIHGDVVADEQGRIVRLSGILQDVTERKQASAERDRLAAQFLQAQKMESVGTLAGGIAHDFNNILSAIMGHGHVALMKMAPDDPQRVNIKSMLEAVDRATQLTKDLLLFSRKRADERKPIDLNEVVGRVDKFLKRVIGEDIECNTVLHGTPIPVHADGQQIEQVLMNLATNARDTMPRGGALTVRTERVHLDESFTAVHGFGKPGAYGTITVSDTGKGMDEETQKRIFEPFFTTKEVGKGTGLGLAVVYGIVKQHDGFITVYSEPGSGTTFRIYLPIIASAAMEEAKAHRKEAPGRGTETILLAEDDKSVRDIVSIWLAEFGYTVIEAVDGEDAVRKFTENKDDIDLLLFDLVMPKMNGKEAFDEVRKIKPGVKVIFGSGYAPDILQQKASLESGASLMIKPFSPLELLAKVRSALDGAK